MSTALGTILIAMGTLGVEHALGPGEVKQDVLLFSSPGREGACLYLRTSDRRFSLEVPSGTRVSSGDGVFTDDGRSASQRIIAMAYIDSWDKQYVATFDTTTGVLIVAAVIGDPAPLRLGPPYRSKLMPDWKNSCSWPAEMLR